MNFFTVMCFVGLHEVAKELENPFKNAPNDTPLNNFQAQFNEAIISVFSGFHPDSWWEVVNESTLTSGSTNDPYEEKDQCVDELMNEIVDQV